jgi:hypothetical protein
LSMSARTFSRRGSAVRPMSCSYSSLSFSHSCSTAISTQHMLFSAWRGAHVAGLGLDPKGLRERQACIGIVLGHEASSRVGVGRRCPPRDSRARVLVFLQNVCRMSAECLQNGTGWGRLREMGHGLRTGKLASQRSVVTFSAVPDARRASNRGRGGARRES